MFLGQYTWSLVCECADSGKNLKEPNPHEPSQEWKKYRKNAWAKEIVQKIHMRQILQYNLGSPLSRKLAAIENHGWIIQSFKPINPIPTSHGRNQPIYERHVTTTGRNRVKYWSHCVEVNAFWYGLLFSALKKDKTALKCQMICYNLNINSYLRLYICTGKNINLCSNYCR